MDWNTFSSRAAQGLVRRRWKISAKVTRTSAYTPGGAANFHNGQRLSPKPSLDPHLRPLSQKAGWEPVENAGHAKTRRRKERSLHGGRRRKPRMRAKGPQPSQPGAAPQVCVHRGKRAEGPIHRRGLRGRMDRAFSPRRSCALSWGAAPGWHGLRRWRTGHRRHSAHTPKASLRLCAFA